MESVTLELRPRLRSLNAYISLLENIDASRIKVILLEDVIEIHISDNIYNLPLPSSVKLLPSSLSSLGITNRWISFRIQTQPSSIYGTFETEIINAENVTSNGHSSNTTKAVLPPKNTDCKFICACCKNEITKTCSFQRILPLPSSDCDPQEWFCCQHGSEESRLSMEPRETDFFYSINYCVLNRSNFEESLKLRNSLVHCNRCLSILGSSHGKSLKIWNCCVEYQIFNGKNSVKSSVTPLSDFLATIKDTAELVIGEKILLEAQDVNGAHYILLKPMETRLNVFTWDRLKEDEDQTVNLTSLFVVKVLYKYGESEIMRRRDEPDVKYCELALPAILAGMNELVACSARFPLAYRRAEDFYIGYLPM